MNEKSKPVVVYDSIEHNTVRRHTDLKPVIGWVGGKTRSLSQLNNLLPAAEDYEWYCEPFVGGATVGLSIQHTNTILSDLNEDLINFYKVVRDTPEYIIDLCSYFHNNHSKEFYYKLRTQWNTDRSVWSTHMQAAVFLYFNRACFNKLWRVNQSGHFNVPFGKHKKFTYITDQFNLLYVSNFLKTTKILCCEFNDGQLYSTYDGRGFVYLDPPYDPVSQTSNFTSYAKSDFKRDKQLALFHHFNELTDNGHLVMLSNNDTEYVRELYSDYSIHEINVSRTVSADKSKRGVVTELCITNY